MSIRSLIQDMRFSRSQRVVQDRSAAAAPELGDSLKQSCWAHMPQELLREVLMRIEASEAAWPPRKSVVACAGVCRSWRILTKEIVKSPVLSGKLTFPISVKQVWVFSLVLVSITCWWEFNLIDLKWLLFYLILIFKLILWYLGGLWICFWK